MYLHAMIFWLNDRAKLLRLRFLRFDIFAKERLLKLGAFLKDAYK